MANIDEWHVAKFNLIVLFLIGALAGLSFYFLIDAKADQAGLYYFIGLFTLSMWFTWSAKRALLTFGFSAVLALTMALPVELFEGGEGFGFDTAFPHKTIWALFSAPYFSYIAMMMFKSMLDEETVWPGYAAFFSNKFRLPIQLVLASLFAQIIIGLLFLWAALFEAIKIPFFSDLFQEGWFIVPLGGAIGGLSIGLIRRWDGFVEAIKGLLFLFSRLLIPIAVAFSLTFLVTLLFTGLEPLWESPSASGLSISIAILLFFVTNGVRQDGSGDMPPRWLNISVVLAIVMSGIFVSLALYAAGLRVGQHGWTPKRFVFVLFFVTCLIYAGGALLALLKPRNRAGIWLPFLSPLNMVVSIGWALILLSLHTPWLDPLRISARSQAARVIEGKLNGDKFEPDYFRFELGRPGIEKLKELRTRLGKEEQDYIDLALSVENKSKYKEKQVSLAMYWDIAKERKSIYEISLIEWVYSRNDYKLEQLLRLKKLSDHPGIETISKEVEWIIYRMKEQEELQQAWQVHAIVTVLENNNVPLAQKIIQGWHCTYLSVYSVKRVRKIGDKAIEELRQMSGRPDYGEIHKLILQYKNESPSACSD